VAVVVGLTKVVVAEQVASFIFQVSAFHRAPILLFLVLVATRLQMVQIRPLMETLQ
jgi:hypothetical protein